MIISPEAILFLINDKKFDDKSILNMARFRNKEITESLRKNIRNIFLEKHVPSETTITNFKIFLKELVEDDSFSNKIENAKFSEEIDLSTPKLNLDYLESGYQDFFRAAKFEDSFVCYEIKTIFKALSDIFLQKENGEDSITLEKKVLRNETLSKLDLGTDVIIDIASCSLVHGKFSLNTLLYISACLDVNNGKNNSSSFQWLFKNLVADLATPEGIKSSFQYYIMFFQYKYAENGEQITSEQISEKLGIEPKSFYRYKKGIRKVNIKHIDAIFDNGDIAYFCIALWRNLVIKITKIDETKKVILSRINEYPRYFEIAEINYKNFFIKPEENLL